MRLIAEGKDSGTENCRWTVGSDGIGNRETGVAPVESDGLGSGFELDGFGSLSAYGRLSIRFFCRVEHRSISRFFSTVSIRPTTTTCTTTSTGTPAFQSIVRPGRRDAQWHNNNGSVIQRRGNLHFLAMRVICYRINALSLIIAIGRAG